MGATNILIYLLRHDLRVSDNPIFHHLASVKDHGFTHLVPVYIFPAQQIEVSGFIRDGSKSPYPEARSQLGNYWRCGPHRAKFLAQSVWNLKQSLQTLGNDLCIRTGHFDDTLETLLKGFAEKQQKVGAVWMTAEEAVEEKRDERDIARLCSEHGVDWKLWQDEKYFVDDRDTNLKDPQDLPDVFTTYRKTQEPLRERPRPTLPAPAKSSLPPFPDHSSVPPQSKPFEIPTSYDALESSLMEPIREVLEDPVAFPEGASSVHPLDGGEDKAQGRLGHLIRTGAMSSYKETRNGLLGVDFSTKLSAYLALGCLTARQIHEEMAGYEDGKMDKFKDVTGYGDGENDGTRAVRFELLWRDYMRLCTRKFGPRLFRDSGFREEYKGKWKTANPGVQDEVAVTLQRFMAGTTGMGLIDASQRELYHTGYTSNRARQNVASFLTKHLGIDWRYGAEWYECLLVDYDVSSNWSNWQYVAGVGNDPRGEARIFNPVKQAFDYDKDGEYVRAWVPEVRPLEKLENVFQAWTASKADLDRHHLSDNVMVTHPIKKIEFSVEGKPKASRRPYMRRRGRGGNGNGNGGNGHGNGNGNGNGPGSSNGNSNSNGSTGHGVGGGSPPHDMGNGHAHQAEYYPAQGQQYQQRPYDAYGPGQYGNGNGNGFRGGPGGSRGQYRGYRGRGGGGHPRGGRGGGGAYMTGRWTNGYSPQPPPYDGGAYYAAPMNRPHWTTTNPGV